MEHLPSVHVAERDSPHPEPSASNLGQSLLFSREQCRHMDLGSGYLHLLPRYGSMSCLVLFVFFFPLIHHLSLSPPESFISIPRQSQYQISIDKSSIIQDLSSHQQHGRHQRLGGHRSRV